MSGQHFSHDRLSFGGPAHQPDVSLPTSSPALSAQEARDICNMVESRLYDAAFPLYCLASLVDRDEHDKLAYLLDTLFEGALRGNEEFLQRLEGRLRHAK